MNDNPQKVLAEKRFKKLADRFPAGTLRPKAEEHDGKWRVVVERLKGLTKPEADDLCFLLSGMSASHEK